MWFISPPEDRREQERHFKIHAVAHFAAAVVCCHKFPAAAQVAEGAFDQGDVHPVRVIEAVAGGEGFVKRAFLRGDGADQFVLIAAHQFAARAPRQKLRVFLDIGDQIKHLRRRKGQFFRLADLWHNTRPFKNLAAFYPMSKKSKEQDNNIITNRKAFHDYFLEEHFEAGIALEGWEVKALRAGRIQIKESHILVKSGEVFLFGAYITPLPAASTHVIADPSRTRKLLLHRNEISKLIGAAERDGYTLVPVNLYWKNGYVKVNLAIAKGKKAFDKRASEKDRDWARQKERLMKIH